MAESVSRLEKIFSKEFSRVYLGNETCETKIPSIGRVKKAKEFCKSKGLDFSLVTPFCTNAGIRRIKSLLPILSGQDELIANDFGVLSLAAKSKAVPVAGRLLNRQFRDPRIASFRGELAEHLSQSQASMPSFRKILSKFGVKRIELDNLVQGIATNLNNTGFSASLYHPIVFVSATRLCLSANAGKISDSQKVGVFSCNLECKKFRFRLSNKAMPEKLLIIGNGLFFENAKLPSKKELVSKGIDRLVLNRSLWPE